MLFSCTRLLLDQQLLYWLEHDETLIINSGQWQIAIFIIKYEIKNEYNGEALLDRENIYKHFLMTMFCACISFLIIKKEMHYYGDKTKNNTIMGCQG